jgi:hypothetical protein
MKKLRVTRVSGGFRLKNELIRSDAHLIRIMERLKTNYVQVKNRYGKQLFRLEFSPKKSLVNISDQSIS